MNDSDYPKGQQRKEKGGLHYLTSLEIGVQQSNLQVSLKYRSLTASNFLLLLGLRNRAWLKKILFLKVVPSINYWTDQTFGGISPPKLLFRELQEQKKYRSRTAWASGPRHMIFGSNGPKAHISNVDTYICLFHANYPSLPADRSRHFQGMSHLKLQELSKIG